MNLKFNSSKDYIFKYKDDRKAAVAAKKINDVLKSARFGNKARLAQTYVIIPEGKKSSSIDYDVEGKILDISTSLGGEELYKKTVTIKLS